MMSLMTPLMFLAITSLWKQKKQNENTKDKLGVIALIAMMEQVTVSQTSKAYKHPLRNRPSNKNKVLLDSASDGDLYFLWKGKDKPFPTWLGGHQSFYAHQMGVCKQMEEASSESISLSILQAGTHHTNWRYEVW